MFPASSWKSMIGFACLIALSFPKTASSQGRVSTPDLEGEGGAQHEIEPGDHSTVDAPVLQELSALGPRGRVIAEAREQVLAILEARGSCAAWLEDSDATVTTVFRSLHYQLGRGTPQIYFMPDENGRTLYKHPWGASAVEYGGSNSTITINSNGPFFVEESRLSRVSAIGGPLLPAGWHLVMVGPFAGNTPEARMTILLHELAHVVGRIPVDDGSWNGESSRNTVEVLRHCKAEIHRVAKRRSNDEKAGGSQVPSRETANRERS